MRLISLHVRHYRLHADTRIEFDPRRTLIGGPNESGKSTLLEAAHRALFLNHRRGGAILKEMESLHHPGTPEVELEFEAGGTSYTLLKRFGGTSKGHIELRAGNHDQWTGPDAEEKLAVLLGLDGPVAPARLASQWAHLWIRQGESGSDPSAAADSQREELLARLQHQGGAAVMQSDQDARVARHFAELEAEIFTATGKIKAGSELEKAGRALETARTRLQETEEIAAKLGRAIDDERQARALVAEVAETLPQLQKQLAATTGQLAKATELRQLEEKRQRASEEAAAVLATLTKADAEIRELENARWEGTSAIEPKRRQIDELRERRTAATEAAEKSSAKLDQAGTATRAARRDVELAERHLALFTCEARLAELDETSGRIKAIREELEPLEKQLAGLPRIRPRDLDQLRDLNEKQATARATLEASAAVIEWLGGGDEITIDGRPLTPGVPEILTDEAELRIGEARVRVRPGGGRQLSEARREAAKAARALEEALAKFGVPDLAAAGTSFEQARALEARLSVLRTRLETLAPEAVAKDLETRRTERLAIAADIERQLPSAPDFSPPPDLPAATATLRHARERLAESETAEQDAKAARLACEKSRDEAARKFDESEKSLRGEEDQLRTLAIKIETLTAQHGQPPVRLEKIAAAGHTRDQAAEALAAVRTRLADLQPDRLEQDEQRFTRAIEAKQATRSEAGNRLAAARAILASDGSSDPHAAVALARAALERATTHHAALQRRADAIQRLAGLFRVEQQRLADRFTAPLAEKITVYLQSLFGPDARAAISLEDGEFRGLRLVRREGVFDFASLSGGTREQLAAAARLAIAELLAEAHDGCLPLVFDDAFTHSDPLRVESLQRMLDLAAGRGLQIVILTCTPADYAALGAREIQLTRP